eukprot:3343781-Amphidinium_carterae.1
MGCTSEQLGKAKAVSLSLCTALALMRECSWQTWYPDTSRTQGISEFGVVHHGEVLFAVQSDVRGSQLRRGVGALLSGKVCPLQRGVQVPAALHVSLQQLSIVIVRLGRRIFVAWFELSADAHGRNRTNLVGIPIALSKF